VPRGLHERLPAEESRATARGRVQDNGLPVRELARLRQAAYRILGTVLLYPHAGSIVPLSPVAAELLVESRPLSSFAFWGVWERLLSSLQELGETEGAGLEAAYAATFAAAADGMSCFPCESAYFPPEATGWVLAELDREYGSRRRSSCTATWASSSAR